jgi:hypothetical protein
MKSAWARVCDGTFVFVSVPLVLLAFASAFRSDLEVALRLGVCFPPFVIA